MCPQSSNAHSSRNRICALLHSVILRRDGWVVNDTFFFCFTSEKNQFLTLRNNLSGCPTNQNVSHYRCLFFACWGETRERGERIQSSVCGKSKHGSCFLITAIWVSLNVDFWNREIRSALMYLFNPRYISEHWLPHIDTATTEEEHCRLLYLKGKDLSTL